MYKIVASGQYNVSNFLCDTFKFHSGSFDEMTPISFLEWLFLNFDLLELVKILTVPVEYITLFMMHKVSVITKLPFLLYNFFQIIFNLSSLKPSFRLEFSTMYAPPTIFNLADNFHHNFLIGDLSYCTLSLRNSSSHCN